MEFRVKDVALQLEGEDQLKVGGYINVTERESEILYSRKRNKWFKEVMKRGVFQEAIDNATGIPLLLEHDWDKQLASTDCGTLQLREDNIGLKFEAVISDPSAYEMVKNGIIKSCSFGFRVLQEKIEGINPRLEKRFVSAIELMEVSLVKNPAYVGSLAETRAYEEQIASDGIENTVEVTEEVAEEVREVVVEETAVEVIEETVTEEAEKINEEVKVEVEDSEDRNFDGMSNSAQEVAPSKESLTEIVNQLIDEKLNAIAKAEEVEEQSREVLEDVKEFHDEIENDLALQTMKNNAEVIKLRLELLKLNELKKGI